MKRKGSKAQKKTEEGAQVAPVDKKKATAKGAKPRGAIENEEGFLAII